MLTFLLRPFLALLPKRWRDLLPGSDSMQWRIATILSGFGESVVALAALLFWYSYYMNLLVDRGLDAAITGKMGPGVTGQEIGFTALIIWATHPLTWLIAYAGVEGSVRLCGAFAEHYLGVLPLYVLDKIFLKITGRSGPSATKAAGYEQGNLSSYTSAIREKVKLSRIPIVPDELCFTGGEGDEILEIRACRRKPDWTPPKTVRYQDDFYRLEAYSDGVAPRPFRYRLRRLSAGVMGWGVLVYSPEEAPLLVKK